MKQKLKGWTKKILLSNEYQNKTKSLSFIVKWGKKRSNFDWLETSHGTHVVVIE